MIQHTLWDYKIGAVKIASLEITYEYKDEVIIKAIKYYEKEINDILIRSNLRGAIYVPTDITFLIIDFAPELLNELYKHCELHYKRKL